VELSLTREAGQGETDAATCGADCIVGVGGDGTANEILNGMNGHDACLAILPMGTANVVARELGIKRDPDQLAELIAKRHTRRIDAGRMDDRLFLLGVGAGLDGAITRRVMDARGSTSNYLKWVLPSVKGCLAYNFAPIQVRIDGDSVSETSSWVVVGNCRFSGGIFPITRRASLADGLLDVCVFHDLSWHKLAALSVAVFSARFPDRKDIVYRQAKTIELEPASDLPVAVQIDGDPGGFLPVRCAIAQESVEVIAP